MKRRVWELNVHYEIEVDSSEMEFEFFPAWVKLKLEIQLTEEVLKHKESRPRFQNPDSRSSDMRH